MGDNKGPRGNMPNIKCGFLWKHSLSHLLIYYLFLYSSFISENLSFSLKSSLFLPEELLFSISCSAGWMVTNTLCVSYLQVRSLFHHHYWNIQSSKLAVSHSTYCPLASIDFDEKSVVIQMIVHLYRITFKIYL